MFEKDKINALSKLNYALDKELVDKKIIPFLNAVNKTDFFYTTSSCYGRITIDESELKINKKTHKWIAKYHRTVNHIELSDALKQESDGVVWIRQLPFILHIRIKDIAPAEKLLLLTKKHGLKKCGIFQLSPKIFIELRGEDIISFPAKYKNKMLVNQDELQSVAELLNYSFLKNKERLEKLLCGFKKIF